MFTVGGSYNFVFDSTCGDMNPADIAGYMNVEPVSKSQNILYDFTDSPYVPNPTYQSQPTVFEVLSAVSKPSLPLTWEYEFHSGPAPPSMDQGVAYYDPLNNKLLIHNLDANGRLFATIINNLIILLQFPPNQKFLIQFNSFAVNQLSFFALCTIGSLEPDYISLDLLNQSGNPYIAPDPVYPSSGNLSVLFNFE
jgi:hypothetical protein